MGILNGKVAMITGGSRGIGEAIVRRFAAEGAQVAFSYRSSSDRADQIVKELNSGNRTVKAYSSDAASFEACQQWIAQVIKDFERIDILVNNAGITKDNLMLRMSEDQWDQVIDVNLKSVFNMTKHVLRPMLKQKGGAIINIGSVVGVFGNAGQANYAASKSGIIGFSKSIAKEVGSRAIRCNVVAPGFIETDMTGELDENTRKAYEDSIPLKRMGTGDDVAHTCAFLGSDLGAYITGQVISVCGGLNI